MKALLLISALLLNMAAFAQPDDIKNIDYLSQRNYIIAKVGVEGNNTVDPNAIILISELTTGEKISIPGPEITNAIRKLWEQKLFSDVQILQTKVSGDYVHLSIKVQELPRLSQAYFEGDVTKGDNEKLVELTNLYPGRIVNENLKMVGKNQVRNFYVDKGYLKAKVTVTEELDTTKNNAARLFFKVDKGEKFKINDIIFHGVSSVDEGKLYRSMKETKRKMWWRIFKRSKFMVSNYEDDKKALITKFNDVGLRDAIITHDTVYDYDESSVNIEITIDEGSTYYFGDFDWVGNTKYRDGFLDTIVGIKKGEVYNQSLLDSRLHFSQNGSDVTSYYMDRGHLFFQLIPKETIVYGDSNYINYEIRLNEGKVAYVRDVRVSGNTKTSDHVIYREIRTKPGDKFSRNEIIRTQRELNNLGYFDPESMDVQPLPNPADGTVDIEYTVAEKPSDQIELSGGWGGGRIVGTLGLVFNNFSLRKLFKKGAWTPLPSGDGQRLSIRAQSNGLWYQALNFSFTEPWLGGKKPHSFTVSAYHSVLSNGVPKNDDGREDLKVTGASLGFGKINKWPDDYFQTRAELGFQRYNVNNYGSLFALDSGIAKSVYVTLQVIRNSIDVPLYPTSGSTFKLSGKFGLPINSFRLAGMSDEELAAMSPQERYKWIQYVKPKFTASWFTSLSKRNKKNKLVLNAKTGFGFLLAMPGRVGQAIGVPPFERFFLGGSGLTGFNNLDGRELIAARGYDTNWLSARQGSPLIAKYVLELRYPISLNPSATIYALAFAEGSNTWENWKTFNPFQVKRAAGVGLRIFLPMFGLMGLDYGWGFDVPDQVDGAAGFNAQTQGKKFPFYSGFQFTIGMNLGDL